MCPGSCVISTKPSVSGVSEVLNYSCLYILSVDCRPGSDVSDNKPAGNPPRDCNLPPSREFRSALNFSLHFAVRSCHNTANSSPVFFLAFFFLGGGAAAVRIDRAPLWLGDAIIAAASLGFLPGGSAAVISPPPPPATS